MCTILVNLVNLFHKSIFYFHFSYLLIVEKLINL